MDVVVLEALVAGRKQLDVDLNAIKGQITEHEAAIDALQERGQLIFEESRRVNRELAAALGLVEPGQGEQAQA